MTPIVVRVATAAMQVWVGTLHTGVAAFVQSLLPKHWTQVLVPVSQTSLEPAAQWAFDKHSTHTNEFVLH